jgi:hypothetical protein
VQEPDPRSQTWPPLHHIPPVLLPGQHGSPVPPHPTQTLAWHTENGAVHPTPPPQHASPGAPHAPFSHPPPAQVPCPPPHVPALATQVLVVWSQHPPPPHHTPSQHG